MPREDAVKILAVSGGIDSMVMLDIFQRDNVVVAHFNHGTRESAMGDMDFVYRVTEDRYHLTRIRSAMANLGENVSEEAAREQRYRFLRGVALAEPIAGEVKLESAAEGAIRRGHEIPIPQIYTAHHLDDLVESIAINLIRGTGWRGLAVLDTPGIGRPFLEPELLPKKLRTYAPFDKKMIYHYATQHNICFRQDPTNFEDHYLRNRLRSKLENFTNKFEFYKLWQGQKKLKTEIDQIARGLLPAVNQPWEREWFRGLDQKVALELLRAGTIRAGISATRPQLEDFRQAILTYRSGKFFNLPGNKLVRFDQTKFYL